MYVDIPVAVSLPHFYNSDPSLLNEVEGLSPNKSLHESIIILQPVRYYLLIFSKILIVYFTETWNTNGSLFKNSIKSDDGRNTIQ